MEKYLILKVLDTKNVLNNLFETYSTLLPPNDIKHHASDIVITSVFRMTQGSMPKYVSDIILSYQEQFLD